VRIWNGLILAVPNFVVATLIVLLAGLYFPQIAIFGYTPFLTDPWRTSGACCFPRCRWLSRCR
jgi:peptide/nickel transport system permease protein